QPRGARGGGIARRHVEVEVERAGRLQLARRLVRALWQEHGGGRRDGHAGHDDLAQARAVEAQRDVSAPAHVHLHAPLPPPPASAPSARGALAPRTTRGAPAMSCSVAVPSVKVSTGGGGPGDSASPAVSGSCDFTSPRPARPPSSASTARTKPMFPSWKSKS